MLVALLMLHSAAASANDSTTTDCCQGAIDFATENGHFYTQASGLTSNPESLGFEISDADGIPFWTAFQHFGGVEQIGYPISRRFVRNGLIHQATQGAVLQWEPNERHVRLVNVLDELDSAGANARLLRDHFVPLPSSDPNEAALSFSETLARRLALLDTSPAIRARYTSVGDPITRFGLPVSPAQDLGPVVALRTQRTVFYHWKQDQPWAKAGDVTIALAGDLFKEAALIPEEATKPEPPPPAARASQLASRGSRHDRESHTGVATWYGAYFQGRAMSNGERYNMWDPTTAACNIYPLGTRLRVTRVATGESIIVRVTDRGAFRAPILVDLSYAAFAQLADPAEGVIRVTIEPAD